MSSYALVFGPADVSNMMQDMQLLYSCDKNVKRRFTQVARLANVTSDMLLQKEPMTANYSRVQIVSMGLLAGMLGIADSLIETRGEPCCAGGVSLGELVALCLSGAISLEDAVAIIQLRPDQAAAGGGEETVGFVMVADGEDWEFYHQPPKMFISVDYGLIHNGFGKLLMISGLRDALENEGQHGPGNMEVLPPELCQSAYHTPLRDWIRKQVEDYLGRARINAPRVPVVTCVQGQGVVRDAEAVKSITLKSETEALHVPNLIRQIGELQASEVVCVGPFLRSLNLSFSAPSSYRDERWVSETIGSLPLQDAVGTALA